MDSNIRGTCILVGLALCVHGGYSWTECEISGLVGQILSGCKNQTSTYLLEIMIGFALFFGMMKQGPPSDKWLD